jgi:DNA topoisomerase VI subunit B
MDHSKKLCIEGLKLLADSAKKFIEAAVIAIETEEKACSKPTAAVKTKAAPKTTQPDPAQELKPTPATVSVDEIKKAMLEIATIEKNKAGIMNMLTAFGYKKITEIPEEKRADFLAILKTKLLELSL